jgi:hypothetical protein
VDKPSTSDKRMNSASLGYRQVAGSVYGYTLSQIGTCLPDISQEFDCSPSNNQQMGNLGLSDLTSIPSL